MLFIRARPMVQRAGFIPRVCRNQYSTHTTTLQSKSLRAAAIGLAIGLPAGFAAHQSKGSSEVSTTRSGSGFYQGSSIWKGQAVKPFTLDDVAVWLRNEESSHQGPSGSGVRSWYSVRCASNSPCEDNYVTAHVPVSGKTKDHPWLFWGVFDGHNGSATSTTLRETLVSYVSRHLSTLYQSGTPSSEAIDSAIISAFCQLDGDIIGDGVAALKDARSLTEAISRLAPGYAGSCAILSIFDPNSKTLRVACTGDCRAVLGRRDDSGKYTSTQLSVDQTGFNELELARVRAEHPGEPDVINGETGRVLGIAISRAFGDGLWKWPTEVLLECRDKFFWKSPRPGYKTPPYLTAEPVVTTTKIGGSGEFMILASDGLWDHLSSQQAVKLVEMWLLSRKDETTGKAQSKPKSTATVAERGSYEYRAKDEHFVVVDKNVAAHLVRNALGGGDTELLCGRAGAQPPLSRYARDDITVQVIFFDER